MKKRKKKKKIKPVLIILPIIVVLLALVTIPIMTVNITKNKASELKDELGFFLESVKEKDSQAAEKSLGEVCRKTEELKEDLNGGLWKAANKIPAVKKQLDVAYQLLDLLTDVEGNLLTPLIDKMCEYPLDELKAGEGFNVNIINVYLDFLEEKQPYLEGLLETMETIDTDSLIGHYLGEKKADIYKVVDSYYEASELLGLLRTFIGDGSDKLYLLAAQNSAEIRASGGFPGSIGTIKIKDGILTIGDFRSVYDVLSPEISEDSGIEYEDYIFGAWIDAPRDACFIPDFPKVARVWAVAYADYKWEHRFDVIQSGRYYEYLYNPEAFNAETAEILASTSEEMEAERKEREELIAAIEEYEAMTADENYQYDPYGYFKNKYHVDGVVSMTPAIIQMLMKDIGEITLSDGTVINDKNATKILQYDLYYKYFGTDTFDMNSMEVSDRLFAETAKTVMKKFVEGFEISKFADYYKLFKETAAKNIVEMWFEKEEEQKIAEEAKASGKLNDDPENPTTGIYLSLADPSKLGWFVDIIPEISEPVVNEDNSRTYDVKVTLNNVMTDEEYDTSIDYIHGGYGGAIRCFVHFVGPAGGYIEAVETSDYSYMIEDSYHDLDVAYNLDMVIERNEPVIVTYKVTTAPGVENMLKAITTPTLTEYRTGP